MYKAIDYYQQALEVDLASFGNQHPVVAMVWNNLGSAWEDKGKHNKAIEYYKKALTVRQEKLGLAHPFTLQTKNNLKRAEFKASLFE